MIRVATEDDWQEVRDKIAAFNEQYFDIPVELGRVSGWFMRHLRDGIVLLSENGLISGLWMQDPVRTWYALVETSWYDTGRDGVRLLREFISAAKMQGVNEVRMTTLNTTPVGVQTLLNRMGFEEIERSHRLTL